MSTLRVSNIEAKADPSSPSVDEKLKVTNSNGDVLIHIDGKTAGITTVGINTTDKSFTVDAAQNVEFLGIVTATKFSLSGGGEITGGDGNFTGIVTSGSGNFTGGLSVGTAVTAATANFTSSLTAASANFTGNVSIAGTLTYEDVTNVDSIGIATARTGIDVTGGHIDLVDNSKIRVGTGDDLDLYHDTTDTYLRNQTGQFLIRGNDIKLQSYLGETYATLANNNAVSLYYDNSKKLETISSGAKVTGALEVTQEYPSIRPTLDLNFAATKTLDRRITFTRDSIGTYTDELGIVRTAPNNVPRFDHDPETGESLGLLIEEARTNINKVSTFRVSNANRFSINSASEQTAGENTNGVIGPDGTANGVCRAFFTGSESDPSGSVYVMASTSSSNGASFTTTNTHTSSVWIRPGLETVWKVLAHSNYASASAAGSATAIDFIFTLTGEGTVTSIESGGIAASVKKYPNNWYRCTLTYHRNSTASVDSGYGVIIFPNVYTNYNANSQTGDIGWFWGPQVEAGAFATSYIPTNGSTATRAVEIAKITGTNFTDFYNQSEGTIVSEHSIATGVASGDNTYVYQVDDGSDTNVEFRLIDHNGAHGDVLRAYGFTGGSWNSPLYGHQTSTPDHDSFLKVAVGVKKDDFGVNFFGGTTYTDTSGDINVDMTQLTIGNHRGGTAPLQGHIRQFKYYPKRLPDAQLQGLTQQ